MRENEPHQHTILSLFEKLSKADTTVEEGLGSSIQIRTKLGKGGHFTILGKLKFHGSSNLTAKQGKTLIVKLQSK